MNGYPQARLPQVSRRQLLGPPAEPDSGQRRRAAPVEAGEGGLDPAQQLGIAPAVPALIEMASDRSGLARPELTVEPRLDAPANATVGHAQHIGKTRHEPWPFRRRSTTWPGVASSPQHPT